jgi:hypothetical protein
MNFEIARYGWLPDLPDHRDHLYAAPVERIGAIPAKVDLRAQCPPVYDQGQPRSCTAMKGYFTLPYACLTDENLASDFWTIRVVQ